MKGKGFLKNFIEYHLIVFKVVGAAFVSLLQTTTALIAYVSFDVLYEIYRKYQADKQQDLSDHTSRKFLENQEAQNAQLAESKLRFEKYEVEQKEFRNELRTQKSSVGLLNRLINEGFIREGDLIKLAGTSGYYQVIVYSVPLKKLVKHLDNFQLPKRKYAVFLEELGFVRLGIRSNTFLLNKRLIGERVLRDNAAEFKKFLQHHFSRLKKEEWKEFLSVVKGADKKTYQTLRKEDYKSRNVLQINFLLTETNINMTNLGYVDGDVIGIADVSNDRKLSEQILSEAEPGKLKLSKETKIRIKEIMLELNIDFLLEGVSLKERKRMSANQTIIKDRLELASIMEFYSVNVKDLAAVLKDVGVPDKNLAEISNQLVSVAKTYQQALEELGISLV